MAFKGWPVEAIEFYEGLEADNSRAYWEAHKQTYRECVLQPMLGLLADLEPEFGPGKVFRPYRDMRFSADKSPYKTTIAAGLEFGGYVQVSAAGLAAGRGSYQLEGEQLTRFRRAVVDDVTGPHLQAIVDDLRSANIGITAHGVLKTAPRGYPRDHPRADLLRYKGMASWRQWPVGAWLGTPRAKDRVVDFLRKSAPLGDWLAEHVG